MSELITAVPARANLLVGQNHEMHAIFTFRPPALTGTTRAPLDIAVAMDVSGSMGGPKIETAKKSLLKLVDHLQATDRLALVTFTTNVETIFVPTLMTPENKKVAREAIRRLQAQASTNLSGGLFQALDHLKEAEVIQGSVRRCLVFTDGLANVGIEDPEKLAVAALEYRNGIGISAFGYGADHNEKLLAKISQDGSFYYIDTPDKILTAFGAELGGLISTYAQNVKLVLTPGEGVKIMEVLNDLTVKEEGGKVTVECDDLLAEQEYSVVLKLAVEKRDNTHPRDVTLVSAEVSYFDVATNKKVTTDAALKVRFVKAGKEDAKDNEAVVNEVALQTALKAQAEAIKLADAGDYAGSQHVMVMAAACLGNMGTARADALAGVSRGLAAENFTAARYTKGGSSEARSLTRGLACRRRVAVKSKGGVELDALYGSNEAQGDMIAAFAGDDDKDDEDDPKDAQPVLPPDPGASRLSGSVTKSRSRNSW